MIINNRKIKKDNHGFSLIELLIVIVIFSLLAVLATQMIFLTVRSSNKSKSLVEIRNNIDYAISVMERHLRNAEYVSPCPNSDTPQSIEYVDVYNNDGTFTCNNVGSGGYIASSSARLTSENVDITSCSLSCSREESDTPYLITIDIEAKDKKITGVEAGSITVSSKFNLRSIH
jgi:prepilin-type N-terminal cleavage/methylation domain-containing protein